MSRRYRIAAILHWSVIVPLILASALAPSRVALAMGVAVLGELGLLAVLPRLGAFRRRVDAQHERRVAADLRAGMLARMGAPHRSALEALERLADGIRKRCGRGEEGSAAASDVAVERWLELDKLLAVYAQLAVAHSELVAAFPAECEAALAAETEKMDTAPGALGTTTDACLERRRAILRRRRETWTQAVYDRNVLMQELSTIVDLLHWMHELCAVAQGESVRHEIERALASWDPGGDALREVSALCRADAELVDPSLLALGREELARRAESARRIDSYAAKALGDVPVTRAVRVSPTGVSVDPALEERSAGGDTGKVAARRIAPGPGNAFISGAVR
jgi:hypothetical protein